VPLDQDMLGDLGEHLREAREHPWPSTCSRGLGQRTVGAAEDGLGMAGDEDAAGDGGGGAPESPSRVRARALCLRGGRAPCLAVAERRRRQASG
jgi:hypothetical protein